jgi:divalent metal cation (Fe/Co/Zn/Cd) transporter
MTENPTRSRLRQRGLRLEYLTLAWNAFEGAAAITAGLVAHSIALTAFGLDSCVEVFASGVAAGQLRSTAGTADSQSRAERRALRSIAACFLGVGVYVGIQSIRDLVGGTRPEHSPFGIAITAAACLVMAWLGVTKRRVGCELGNLVLSAEASFSLVDSALSATVLLGLGLNALAGVWWADPAVAIAVATFALREGREGWSDAARVSPPWPGSRASDGRR